MSDRARKALAEASLPGEPRTYDAISKLKSVPLSTFHHHAQKNRNLFLSSDGFLRQALAGLATGYCTLEFMFVVFSPQPLNGL
jgi:hypothetical protein